MISSLDWYDYLPPPTKQHALTLSSVSVSWQPKVSCPYYSRTEPHILHYCTDNTFPGYYPPPPPLEPGNEDNYDRVPGPIIVLFPESHAVVSFPDSHAVVSFPDSSFEGSGNESNNARMFLLLQVPCARSSTEQTASLPCWHYFSQKVVCIASSPGRRVRLTVCSYLWAWSLLIEQTIT